MDPLVGGLIMGGISGITSIFGGNAQAKAQAGAQAYQNRLSQEQTRIQNSFKDRAFGRAVSTTKEQIGENLNAFSRATAQERARFNEQLYGFSTQRQSAIRDLIQTQGMANASERYGRSAGRMKSIEIMGNYGRNQRIFTDSVASAGRQYNRNQESFNQARYEADRQTVAGLANASDSFLPGMAQTSYTGGGNNSFLTIASGLMQGAQAGLNMYSSMGGTFGGGGGGSNIPIPKFSFKY